jgi:hypothetical protein
MSQPYIQELLRNVPVLERVSGLKFNVDFLWAILQSVLIREIKSIP